MLTWRMMRLYILLFGKNGTASGNRVTWRVPMLYERRSQEKRAHRKDRVSKRFVGILLSNVC